MDDEMNSIEKNDT